MLVFKSADPNSETCLSVWPVLEKANKKKNTLQRVTQTEHKCCCWCCSVSRVTLPTTNGDGGQINSPLLNHPPPTSPTPKEKLALVAESNRGLPSTSLFTYDLETRYRRVLLNVLSCNVGCMCRVQCIWRWRCGGHHRCWRFEGLSPARRGLGLGANTNQPTK